VATIKLNSEGRVLISSGESGAVRVRCACCDSGELCCVYPASCGVGPPSITFYGVGLLGGEDGTIFGDIFNGVFLEGDVWGVYRNGQRTTRECLGLALPEQGEANVAADLPTSLVLSLDYADGFESFFVLSTLNYNGGVSDEAFAENALFGQCYWAGASGAPGQNFDEGWALAFNPQQCRWELWDGPLGTLFAYRADGEPAGSYTAAAANITNIVIA
jgi:hypothetical protein